MEPNGLLPRYRKPGSGPYPQQQACSQQCHSPEDLVLYISMILIDTNFLFKSRSAYLNIPNGNLMASHNLFVCLRRLYNYAGRITRTLTVSDYTKTSMFKGSSKLMVG
jgi:hypothetical protein